jgi:hypothetical protein
MNVAVAATHDDVGQQGLVVVSLEWRRPSTIYRSAATEMN